jgi:hypothetical protein
MAIAREDKVKTQIGQVKTELEQVRKRGLPPLLRESGGKPPFLTCSILVWLFTCQ